MAVVKACELRLLRCALFQPLPKINPVSVDSALECSLLRAVEFIEQGLYAQVGAMEIMREVFGDLRHAFRESAKAVYAAIAKNVREFVDGNDGDASAVLLVLTAAVGFLFVFLQSNFTGPEVDFPVFPTIDISELWSSETGRAWDSWARSELMVDGCDILGKCAYPQYLLLANLLFEAIKWRNEPSTRVWWASRALFFQQRILDERSQTLLKEITSGYSEVVKIFGTKMMKSYDGWYSLLNTGEEDAISSTAFVEAALVEYYYGHADEARVYIIQAERIISLKYSVEGAMGYRRQHQIDPKAQLVLRDESDLDVLQRVDGPAKMEDVLLQPKLESSEIKFLHQKVLTATQQAIMLVRCMDVKKKSAEDELTSWEMAPYIEAVDAQQETPFMIKSWCELLRVEWEISRGPTRERAFLLMDDIVSNIREGGGGDGYERMNHLFCVQFPCVQALLKQFANMLVGMGSIGEALKLFEELELWHSLIDCHRLLGDTARAVSLIKEHLQVSPLDPRLWCSLGEATSDDACFLKSWEVSGGRFAAAQRSLARSAFNRKEYGKAVKHWDLALGLNPLNSNGWFSSGFAALKDNQPDKALDSFIRAVQLDPEHGEAFNNIAALNMRKKNYREANLAFQQALKFRRNSWELWSNSAQALFELGNDSQAIMALAQVFELSPKNVDIGLLTQIVERAEVKKQASDSIDGEDRETKNLMDLLGSLLSKMSLSGKYGGEVWGLKARWHKLSGDLVASSGAVLRQVRAYQGSDWQHDHSKFQRIAEASLHLCRLYVQIGGKREISAAQRHLLNTLKQAQEFTDTQEYKALETILDEVQANQLLS